ncbi:MAG: 2OG-Fe(II) oxygenase [Myxococcota bacterium]|nr:2OG-Fe(II) oxygenase [Myxococcota bacterium]
MTLVLVEMLLIGAFFGWRFYTIRKALRRFSEENSREIVTKTPQIVTIKNFLDDSDITSLKRMAKPRLRRSRVITEKRQKAEQASLRTTSSAMLVGFKLNPVLSIIRKKASVVTGLPMSHIEGLQVVRYQKGEAYGPHYDAFDFERYPKLKQRGQRLFTLIVYLNDLPRSSGDTVFPELGISIQPQKGSALFFKNTDSQGNLDRRMLHEGSQLQTETEKWIVNIWVRDQSLHFNLH